MAGQAEVRAVLERASAFRREQNRPVAVGAWDPGSAVAAIREKLPDFHTWSGPQTPEEGAALADRKTARVAQTAPRVGSDYQKFARLTLPQLTTEQVGPLHLESTRAFFARVDANHDGLVERRELQRHRAEHWPTKSEL